MIENNILHVMVVTDDCNSYGSDFMLGYTCKPSPSKARICIADKAHITIDIFAKSRVLCSGTEVRLFDFDLGPKKLDNELIVKWGDKEKIIDWK